jgi:hypothetical protein
MKNDTKIFFADNKFIIVNLNDRHAANVILDLHTTQKIMEIGNHKRTYFGKNFDGTNYDIFFGVDIIQIDLNGAVLVHMNRDEFMLALINR